MKASDPPSLRELLKRTHNRMGLCSLTILGWIAASDGRVSGDEHGDLVRIASAHGLPHMTTVIVALAEVARDADIQIASEYLRDHLEGVNRGLFLDLAICMAIRDGLLATPENYILQYLADLLGFSRRALGKQYWKATNRRFPDPADTSSASWWEQTEARQQQQERERSRDSKGRTGRTAPSSSKRQQALRTLGLEEGATRGEIKKAYRRLSMVHHPDRFQSLGKEAVEAATITFRRIKDAYDLLMEQ